MQTCKTFKTRISQSFGAVGEPRGSLGGSHGEEGLLQLFGLLASNVALRFIFWLEQIDVLIFIC